MEGFGRWKAFLERAFPKSTDFAVLLAGLATRVRDSIQECQAQILAEKPDLDRTDATFKEVRKTGKAVTDALNESFATSFDREDILRAVEELIWVAEYADHAVRERVVLRLEPDPAIRSLIKVLSASSEQLAEAFGLLSTDSARSLEIARELEWSENQTRRLYENAIGELFVTGADPIDVMKRREIYHHLTDGGKRLRKVARVLSMIVVKDPS